MKQRLLPESARILRADFRGAACRSCSERLPRGRHAESVRSLEKSELARGLTRFYF